MANTGRRTGGGAGTSGERVGGPGRKDLKTFVDAAIKNDYMSAFGASGDHKDRIILEYQTLLPVRHDTLEVLRLTNDEFFVNRRASFSNFGAQPQGRFEYQKD